MTKGEILDQLQAVLEAELDVLTRAAKGSFAAATDPDSRAENKYDTRTLEASYVARGQAQRVEEAREAVHVFAGFSRAPFPADSEVSLAALVTLELPSARTHYFMAPCAGGTETQWAGEDVYVITPASPLGQRLLGRRAGEKVQLRAGLEAKIAQVQ